MHNKNCDDICMCIYTYIIYTYMCMYTYMKMTPVSIAQEASLWCLPAEDPVLSWASPCEICGGQSGNGTNFSPSTSVFPWQNHCANTLFISIYSWLLPEGRAGEVWEPSKMQTVSEIWDRWIQNFHLVFTGPGGYLRVCHSDGPYSITGLSVWDLWWTKWHWDGFFSKYLDSPCQCHSINPLYSFMYHRRCLTFGPGNGHLNSSTSFM
jgi:hypothetical protein